MSQSQNSEINLQEVDNSICDVLQNYPAIWDVTCYAHKIKGRRENAFAAMASVVGCSVEIAEKRYKFLREKYRKEKAKLQEQTRSGAGAQSEAWPLLDCLRFLEKVQRKRTTSSNFARMEQEYSPVWMQYLDEEEETDLGPSSASVSEQILSPAVPRVNVAGPSNTTPVVSPMNGTSAAGPMNGTSAAGPSSAIQKKKHKGQNTAHSETMEKLVAAAEVSAAAMAGVASGKIDLRCQSFGTYVGTTLASFPKKIQNEVIQNINNILYAASENDDLL